MPSSDAPTFASLLRSYRLQAGLTQRKLAELAGMGLETVSALERGIHPTPYRDTVARLATALALIDDDRSRLEAIARRAAHPRASRRHTIEPIVATDDSAPPTNRSRVAGDFVGRDDMLADVIDLCRAQRLVTLVGTGGVGKTRLAQEAAARQVTGARDGIWFVDLAPLRDTSLVGAAIATAVGCEEPSDRPIMSALATFLRRRKIILILDNCEHVVPDTATTVATILRECPDVQIIATSRQPLHLTDEWVYDVLPLACPTPECLTLRQALDFGAAALLLQRAQAADNRFTPDDRDVHFVVEICRRLDGLPLAIELAASRVRSLGLAGLTRRLDERFSLLTSIASTAAPRHRTLGALIDWSYELLASDERLLFTRFAIFDSSFALEAAEAVCAAFPLEKRHIAGLAGNLVDKSLLVVEPGPGSHRYRLLDSIREYAAARLTSSGEGPMLALRHAEAVADFLEQRVVERPTTPRRRWLAAIGPEEDNARAALSWSLAGNAAPSVGARIAVALAHFWYECGRSAEAMRWVEAAFSAVDDTIADAVRARLWLARAITQTGQASLAAAQRANQLFSTQGDLQGSARSYFHLAIAYRQMTRFREAESAIDRALVLFSQAGETRTFYYAIALGWRAAALVGVQRYDEARRLFDEDVELCEALGDKECAAVERLNYAELEFAVDNPTKALTLIDLAVGTLRNAKDMNGTNERFLVGALLNAAACRLIQNDFMAAFDAAREALIRSSRVQVPIYTAIAVQHLATVAAIDGQLIAAARFAGAVDEAFSGAGLRREPTEQRTYAILLAKIRAGLDDIQLGRLLAEGARLSETRLVQESLAIERPSVPAWARDS